MNFNQLTAAAAAAAAGNNNINMNSFTTAVSNILAQNNIDLSSLGLGSLGGSAALSAAANSLQQQQSSALNPNPRHNLPQAHHHRHSSSSNNSTSIASLNSNAHMNNSISSLANADLANLPASISNLTSSALADLAASAGITAHQTPSARSGSSSLQSAHHRSSSSATAAALAALTNPQHHLNHHSSPSATITAAHQSTSAAKAIAAHQSHNTTTSHHRHSSSSHNNAHNSSYNNLNINNNVSKNSISNSFNTSFSNLNSIVNNNNLSNSSNHITTTAKISAVPSATGGAPTQTIIATNNINSVTPPKDSICYRIGDCVYYESSPSLPLQIGKIDEICRINGDNNIEVKVVSFFRRRDISSSLMTLADKYQYDEVQEDEIKQMSEEDKNLLRQRELFYSRQIETIPATAIRGKCTVQLLNESETLASYMSKEDHYFYTLVYDPQQKTITADRGEIRVGQRYQAEVQQNPIYSPQSGGDPTDLRDLNEMETMIYTPDHNLTDDDINKFMTIAKSVGTFARALDCSSSIKQPSLHLTAASASRDVTLLYAMQILHANDYDLGKAVCALVPSTGPVLCRDEIEEWTAGEATLFEEAIEKYGREFNEIRQDILPWKSVKNIVEYYYMWKTTDRSINQRRMKALEAENKVSVLFISDPENKSLNNATSSASNADSNSKKAPTNSTGSTSSNAATTSASGTSGGSSGGPLFAVAKEDSTNQENSNATLKRRQVTEQLPKHTTPGENLRWLATSKIKKMRYDNMTKKQLRHMSRCPWERRAALVVPK